jgi:hypothetical protein
MDMRVDLPAPLAPTSAVMLPRWTSNEQPRSASVWRNFLCTSRTVSALSASLM